MNDGLICGMCKGEKVIRTPVSNYTKVNAQGEWCLKQNKKKVKVRDL